MNWVGVVLSLILGLVIVSWQDVHAARALPIKSNNATKPGNKTFVSGTPLAERYLYSQFACRGKADGLRLPVAGSCVDYYECQQGKAQQLKCNKGLHFSAQGLTCLDSRLSKCVPEQTADTGRCEGPCCYRDDGLYPASDSCSDFIICMNRQTLRRNCGRNLHFSPEKQICDIPERAQCVAMIDRDIIQEENQKHLIYKVSHRVCQNKPDGYSVPILASCNKFYICIHGTGFLKSCGKLQFNLENRYCDTITRNSCVGDEADDMILDEDEYEPIETRPMPIPQPRPNLKPIPLDEEEEDDYEIAPPHRKPNSKYQGKVKQSGKRPRPLLVDEEEIEYDIQPAYPPHSKPQVGKIPRPPVVYEEDIEIEDEPVSRPHKKAPSKQRPQDGRPQVGKKPVQKPSSEEEIVEEEYLSRPNKKPQVPMPPITGTVPMPPNPEDEEYVAAQTDISNVCADKPVGALLPIPGDCNKYIRCRWDWFERRAVEIMTCPKDMHFNAKSKYCDWPESAGCMSSTKKSNEISKKIKKFSSL